MAKNTNNYRTLEGTAAYIYLIEANGTERLIKTAESIEYETEESKRHSAEFATGTISIRKNASNDREFLDSLIKAYGRSCNSLYQVGPYKNKLEIRVENNGDVVKKITFSGVVFTGFKATYSTVDTDQVDICKWQAEDMEEEHYT